MNNLLNALDWNIKPAGRDKWTARCPVHGDKDYAMSIKQIGDGSVLAHCHACGANGYDLYTSLGLELDELFGGKKLDKGKDYAPSKVKREYEVDKMAVDIFDNCVKKGEKFNLEDKRRYRLATARIEGVKQKYNI